MFDGLLLMNDSNLQFSFLGQVDLNQSTPEFDFTLQLNKARPAKLNLFKQFPNAELAFNIVITSYSIHYTKLYDVFIQTMLLPELNLFILPIVTIVIRSKTL